MAEWVWIDDGSLVLGLQVLMPLFSCWFHLYLSILILLDTMKQTKRSTAEDPSETHHHRYPPLCHQKLSISLWYALSGQCNTCKKQNIYSASQQVIFSAWLVVGWHRNHVSPQTLCIPLPPLHAESCTPICSLPWELLVTALCSICHILNEWWWLNLNYLMSQTVPGTVFC